MESAPEPSGDLCTACGFCCDGTLFNFGKASPAEEPVLAAAGFRMCNSADGQRGFTIPCHKLENRRCTYYDQRPATCRAYRCTTLIALDEGRITPTQAHHNVAAAQAAIAAIRALLPKGEELGPLLARVAAGEMADARLLLHAGVLNLLLDRHFRKDRQQVWNPTAAP